MVKNINAYRSYALAGATVSVAISIGFLMQSSEPGYAGHQMPDPASNPATSLSNASEPPSMETIALSAGGLPSLPFEILIEDRMLRKTVALTVSRDAPVGDLPEEVATPNLACDVSLTAEALPAALIALDLTAPCLTGERVVIHHGDLRFTDIIGSDGRLSVAVPALSEPATFVAVLSNGDGAMVTAEAGSLQFYDRIAVQWQGQNGVELHAREYGAEYNSVGHVWRGAGRDVAAIAEGDKGFLTRLGNETLQDGLMAEIYTFPSGSAKAPGDIWMTIEARVSEANCGKQISAKSIETRPSGVQDIHTFSLEMPECDAVGELLVLKNLLQDLKIAGK